MTPLTPILSALLLSSFWSGIAAQEGCFDTSTAIVLAQVQDVLAGATDYKEYVICDDAVITVGLPGDAQFSTFVGGEFPLGLIRPNAKIKCNGCIVKDGYVQFVSFPNIAIPGIPEPLTGLSIANTTVEGITFAGQMVDPTGGSSEISVVISAPGSITFQDCSWKDLNTGSIIGIGSSLLFPNVEPNTISLTVKDSNFENIEYTDYLISIDDEQEGFIEGNTFSNIDFLPDSLNLQEVLILCYRKSVCTVINNCFQDVEIETALFGAIADGTFVDTSGNNADMVRISNETLLGCEDPVSIYTSTCLCIETENKVSSCAALELDSEACPFGTTTTSAPSASTVTDAPSLSPDDSGVQSIQNLNVVLGAVSMLVLGIMV